MTRWKRFWAIFTLAALWMLVPVRVAHAAPMAGDEVVFGDDVTLGEGEHIDGDVVIVGGSLTMRSGSLVSGDVTVLIGDVDISGTVSGDVVALGGDVSLRGHAQIAGDVVALGGALERAEGVQTGQIIQGPVLGNTRFWRELPFFALHFGAGPWSLVWRSIVTLGMAVVMTALAVTVVALWPAQTGSVGHTIVRAPLPSLGVGCLLYPLTASLSFFLLLTICLSVFVPVIALVMIAASLLGWIALGMLWGRQLVRWLGWGYVTPLVSAGVGMFTLSVLLSAAGLVPLLNTILVIGASSIGLGAVVLSRFGTTRYPGSAPPPES